MIVGLKLNKGKELSKNSKIHTFVNPQYVYIPLVSGSDRNITVVVKKGDYVYKGSIVGKSKGAFRIPIHSSVSGIVVDFVEKDYVDGTSVKCVKIENDYKEQLQVKKVKKDKINRYSKEDFIKALQNCGIIGMGGAGFPTYVKYNTDKKIETLIVNAVECEPYITADYALIVDKMDEILEAIDAVMEINGIKEGIIAIKKNNSNLIKQFQNYLGTYPKIKVVGVSDIYPMGWERTLINKVKHVEYHKLPLEKGIVVNNISTMYSIYQALKYNIPLIERVVTFTGENLKNPQNILVRVGTSFQDIIENIGGVKTSSDLQIIAGGPMMGTRVADGVVTANLNNVLVITENKDNDVTRCVRCGKCTDVCPAHLSPVLIRDNLKNVKRLKQLKAQRCIECGLCSYICPSKLALRENVKEAKEKLMEEGK